MNLETSFKQGETDVEHGQYLWMHDHDVKFHDNPTI